YRHAGHLESGISALCKILEPLLSIKITFHQSMVLMILIPFQSDTSKNVVIIGQSGAGKSSLINMICPGANAPTSNDTFGVEKGYTCNLGRNIMSSTRYKSHARNFKKFKSVADKLGVPVVVVVTNLEDFRGSLENW
ncbi:hypothetical protein BD769DRAFT_1393731, partial [Suillus cothurnatus]